MEISALSLLACLLSAAMAAVMERQASINPFNQLPKAPNPFNSIPQAPDAAAAKLPAGAGAPAPSLVETVVLIAPSGTVGGSILITDVPANQPFTFHPSPQPTPSFVETVILIPPSGTVGGSILITNVPISQPSISSISTSTLSRSSIIKSSSSTIKSSSSSSSSSTSSLSSTTTAATNTFSSAKSTAPPLSSQPKKSTLTGGKIAGITVGIAAFALIFAIIAYLCLRRRRKSASPDTQVYPEEAYLYDPPLSVATSSAAGLSQHPINGEAMYNRGAPVGISSRPVTPSNLPAAEREGLLSGSDGGPGSVPSSTSYPGQRGVYVPAPRDEMDLTDGRNHGDPFVDQNSYDYDGGDYAVTGDQASIQSTPGRTGEVISPQMRAVRRAWGWE